MDQLNAKLINVKTTALALTRDFAAMTDTQRAERYGQLVQAAIDNLNAPLDEILTKQGDQVAYQREYAELIANGTLPALAEEILKIREQVAIQLKQLDTSLAVLEASKLKLEAEGKWTEELQKQLDLLKEQRGIIEGKGKEAEDGATEAQSPGQRLQDAYTKVQGQLNELTDPVNQITAGAEAIGSAFGQAFKDVASGAKTAQQALADAFQGIANHFLDMASQMIAKWIEMQIIGLAQKILGAAAGAGGGGAFGEGFNPLSTTKLTPGGIFEGGGYTGNAPRTGGLDGKGGFMAMLHPQETVVDHTRAMGRYSPGASQQQAPQPLSMDVNYNVTQINEQRYVTEDQFRAGMRQSAKDGAKAGQAMTLRTMRNSPNTRQRIGI